MILIKLQNVNKYNKIAHPQKISAVKFFLMSNPTSHDGIADMT